MDREGPALEPLLHRIAEAPEDFILPASAKEAETVAVAAVVNDVAAALGVTLTAKELEHFDPSQHKDPSAAGLGFALLMCWLLTEEWFRQSFFAREKLLALLRDVAADLAAHGTAKRYHSDPDRREELARLVLAHFGYRPAGETVAQAQDRLTSLSIVERERVLRASKVAEERARAIRAALAKKAADEAADKWTRE